MAQFTASLWDANLTMQENADKMGICYAYACTMAGIHHLDFKRKKHARGYVGNGVKSEPFIPAFKSDKGHVQDGQTFEGSGAD